MRALTVPFVTPQAGATYCTVVASPIGELALVGDGESLTGLYLGPTHRWAPPTDPAWRRDAGPFAGVTHQLEQYFAGDRRTFDLPVAPTGTPWQIAVWTQLADVPYGTTDTYGAVAKRLGSPNGARAVGLANGRNPVSIIVPCHRIVGAGGGLTGYGGGLDRKRQLLALETPGALSLWSTGLDEQMLLESPARPAGR